jgi:hypothetical protein
MRSKNGIKFSRSRRHAQNVAIRADYHRLGAQLGEIFFGGTCRSDDSDLVVELAATHGWTERRREPFIR